MRHDLGHRIQYEECFPAGDRPARSADMVSWGPHNVLQLCMRWCVKFFVDDLRRPSSETAVRQHPLLLRPDQASEEVVIGAKWAVRLLPEGRYPAEARICVSTGANLIVYRVARWGGRTRVSSGFGIGLCFCTADLAKERDGMGGSGGSVFLPSEGAAGVCGGAAVPESGKAHTSSTDLEWVQPEEVEPTKKKKRSFDGVAGAHGDAGKGKRRAGRWNSSDGHGQERTAKQTARKPAKTSAGVGGPSGEEARLAETSRGNGSAVPERYQRPLVDYFWMDQDVLLLVTTDAVYRMPFSDRFEDELTPQLLTLPVAAYHFQEDFLGTALAFPSAATLVQCSRQVSTVLRGCPVFSALRNRVLIVASAFVLRVLLVTHECVRILHWVEVPALLAIPSCVCAFWGQIHSSTRLLAGVSAPPEPWGVGVGGPGVASQLSAVPVQVLLASSLGLEYGHFLLDLNGVAPGPSNELAVPPFSRHLEDGGSLWVSCPVRVPEGFVEHLFVRGLSLLSVEDLQAPNVLGRAVGAPSLWSLLGVSRQGLFAMILGTEEDKLTVVQLFSCPSLAAATAAPVEAAVAICGCAVHVSRTMAMLAVEMGRPNHDPLQLYPIPVNITGGVLHRFLELQDVLTWYGKKPPGRATEAPEDALGLLLLRQRRSAFVWWEALFPRSHDNLSLRVYGEGWRRFHAAQPCDQGGPPPETQIPAPGETGTETVKLPPPGGAGGGGVIPPNVHEWRRRYLQLRQRYGVELFLRHPLPGKCDQDDAAEAEEEDALAAALWSTEEASAGAGTGGARMWWRLLRGLWRRCPSDVTPLYELVLGNAVRVLAVGAGFAGLALGVREGFWATDARAADAAEVLNPAGAADFVRLYLRELRQGLLLPTRLAQGRVGGLARWCCTPAWATSLHSFLGQLGLATEEGVEGTLYACSVCDRPQAAALTWHFRCDSRHPSRAGASLSGVEAQDEVHTTVFSPRTFAPLSLYAETAVLTSCLGCGFCDFALGPLCCICAGLLK